MNIVIYENLILPGIERYDTSRRLQLDDNTGGSRTITYTDTVLFISKRCYSILKNGEFFLKYVSE